jgi:hypothetical protein
MEEQLINLEMKSWIVKITIAQHNNKWGFGCVVAGHHAGFIRGTDQATCVFPDKISAISYVVNLILQYADHYATNYTTGLMPDAMKNKLRSINLVQLDLF